MILGAHRDRMHKNKVSLDGFTIRNSQSSHPSLEYSILIATILIIPKLQDYLVLAVVVRELTEFYCGFDAFSVSRAHSLPVEFATLLKFLSPNPNPNPHLNRVFRFFNHVFPSRFCTRYYCTDHSDLQ